MTNERIDPAAIVSAVEAHWREREDSEDDRGQLDEGGPYCETCGEPITDFDAGTPTRICQNCFDAYAYACEDQP